MYEVDSRGLSCHRFPSMSAPCSLASRKLMIDANPIFLMPATDVGVTAPAHATVVFT
jgi:hypothetical protein